MRCPRVDGTNSADTMKVAETAGRGGGDTRWDQALVASDTKRRALCDPDGRDLGL